MKRQGYGQDVEVL